MKAKVACASARKYLSRLALCWSAAVVLLALASPAAQAQTSSGPAQRPNIVFILADDFSTNLVEFMPNLKALQSEGASFANYFVTNSLCCPSRSSIFTGRLPHNTHVLTNRRRDGGYQAFVKNGNDNLAFAVALQAVGYKTAMLGKYLNGYLPGQHPTPPGWTDWYVGGAAYANYNYDLSDNGRVVHFGAKPEDYLTDVLAARAESFIRSAGSNPFFIEIATFAPHAPYTPAPRDADKFPGLTAPRTPAFGWRADGAAPKWLQSIQPLGPQDIARLDRVFRLRAQAVQAIDAMLGRIRAALVAAGRAETTYIVFSSDNGLHLGEYSLRPGKMTPFDIDVHVPLIVSGPKVVKGAKIDQIVENIDLAPTFAELSGKPVQGAPDGHSLVPLLAGTAPAQWRQLAVIEHTNHRHDTTDPDAPVRNGGNPPTYIALRTADALYVEYGGEDIAYYDLRSDPHELQNAAATLPADKRARLHALAVENGKCQGPNSCWQAQSRAP